MRSAPTAPNSTRKYLLGWEMPKNDRASPRIPLRHLSVRVPWHDAGWDGTVCRSPRQNSSCLALTLVTSSETEDIDSQQIARIKIIKSGA